MKPKHINAYMQDDDWLLAEEIVKCTNVYEFLELLDSEAKKESFYWRIIGWPEGKHYMRDIAYAERMGWVALVKHDLPKIRAALETRSGAIPD